MVLHTIRVLRAFIAYFLLVSFSLMASLASALAQEAAPAHSPGFGVLLSRMLPMFAIVFLIFYFMVMKPQQDKIKTQRQMLESLKRGDNVVTSGGILAKVAGVEQNYVLLEVSNNVKIKVEASHVVKKIEKRGADKTAA